MIGSKTRGTSAPLVQVENVSGSVIPGRSIVQVTDGGIVGGRYVAEVDQPDGTEGALFYVTHPFDIPISGTGWAYIPISPVWVKYSSLPVPVETVGPSSGSWQVSSSGSGFDALAVNTTDTLVLVKSQGGGGGGCSKVAKIFLWSNAEATAGNISVTFIYDGEEGTATFAYNDSGSDIEDDFEGAVSTLTTGDVTVTVGQSDGSVATINNFPVIIEFPDITLFEFKSFSDTLTVATDYRLTGDICCG